MALRRIVTIKFIEWITGAKFLFSIEDYIIINNYITQIIRIETTDINLVYIFIFFIIIMFFYIFINKKYFKIRSLLVFFMISTIFTFINYIFFVTLSPYYKIQLLILFFFLYTKLFSYIKSDEVDDENVSIIFYKPKKIKQFLLSMFGLSYSSAGLVINRNIYQMRYEKKTLQKVPFREDSGKYLKEKYLIINTGFKWKDLKGDWESNLLSQSARQKKTLYLRFNCLRSSRFVLNQIPDYKYYGEVFPCLYLLRLKNVKLFKKLIKKNKNMN